MATLFDMNSSSAQQNKLNKDNWLKSIVICLGCHSVDANNIGPKHANVFGRKAGSIKDFEYSPALRNSNIVWNEKNLDRWLQDPESYLPGQQMDVSVSKADDRKNLIAYLKTLNMKNSRVNKP